MSFHFDPSSYIIVVISAHGYDDPSKRLAMAPATSFDRPNIRKLTMCGRKGTLYFGIEEIQKTIFETFQKIKAEHAGERFDRMLMLVRDALRESYVPRMLGVYDALLTQMSEQALREQGAEAAIYPPHQQPDVSDWVQYTSASYSHTYSFKPKGDENLGIWIVDCSHIALSHREPIDIYRPDTKNQHLDWRRGPSILDSSQMYFSGEQPTEDISMEELAARLSVKHSVANVNFIDLSCRQLHPFFLANYDDTPSTLVTATPTAAFFPNTQGTVGIDYKKRPLPVGWTKQEDEYGRTYYDMPNGQSTYDAPTEGDFKQPYRAIRHAPILPPTPQTQRFGAHTDHFPEVPIAHRSVLTSTSSRRSLSSTGSVAPPPETYGNLGVPVANRTIYQPTGQPSFTYPGLAAAPPGTFGVQSQPTNIQSQPRTLSSMGTTSVYNPNYHNSQNPPGGGKRISKKRNRRNRRSRK